YPIETLMNNENAFLTLFAAFMVSIAVCLGIAWAGPVTIWIAGLSVFCLVLWTGWSSAGINNIAGVNILNLSGIWSWLGLTVWFGIASIPHWPWFAFVVLFLAFSVRWLLKKSRCSCPELPEAD
ncbi:MAG TPA: hypothetical protein PKW73_16215, partial [Candidatus Obscuribacter sp.]|nr:hypothetical protein [Candidatus Obscuribacter sp.]